MATFTKPAKVPRWADDLSNVVDPGEAVGGLKDTGWIFEAEPPSSVENWRANLNGEWWKWTDERWADGVTADTIKALFPTAYGSDDFVIETLATEPRIGFNKTGLDTSLIKYVPGSDLIELHVAGKRADFNSTGLTVLDGLRVGFPGAPTADRVEIGDANFALDFDGTDGIIIFDHFGGLEDHLRYDRTIDAFKFRINGVNEVQADASGLRIRFGLYVGSLATAPTEDEVRMDGNLHVGGRQIFFGIASDDRITHDDTANEFSMFLDTTEEWTFETTQLDAHNNNIVNVNGLTGTNLFFTGTIGRDATDFIQWVDNTQLGFFVNAFEEMRLVATGLAIQNGLYVGDRTGTPLDNDIVADGGIRAGSGVTDPAAGDGIFSNGLVIGFDAAPGTSTVRIGNVDFSLDGSTASEPTIFFDQANGDSLVFNRTSNRWDFIIGSDTIYSLTTNSILPDNDGVPSLGEAVNDGDSADKRWSNVYSKFGTFHDDLQVPANQTDLHYRHAQNMVVARGHIPNAGGFPTGDHWNVDTSVRNSIGDYTVTLDLAVDINCSYLVTARGFGGASRRFAQVFATTTTTFQVLIHDDAGALQDADFTFAVIGRPSTLEAQ